MSKIFKKGLSDHNENRGKICLLCLRIDTRNNNSKFGKIIPGGVIEQKINEVFAYNVSLDDHLPNAVCSGCLLKFYRNKVVQPQNLNQFARTITTRSQRTKSKICQCKVCLLAREPLFQIVNGRNVANLKNKTKRRQKTK